MNLQHEWQNMSDEMYLQVQKVALENILIDKQSHSLLQSLLFKLKWKMRWIRIIDIPLLILAFLAKGHLQILLLGLFLSYEVFRVFGMNEFYKIKTSVDYTTSTQQVLKNNLYAIRKMLRLEVIWGYIFLPLSGPVGMLAYLLYKHEYIQAAVATPHFVIKIILTALLGIPFFFLAQKMNDSIFKAPVQELEEKIQALNSKE